MSSIRADHDACCYLTPQLSREPSALYKRSAAAMSRHDNVQVGRRDLRWGMPKSDPPIDRVRRLAMKSPDVEEGTTFGYPAFKVAGKAFAWFPRKKEVEQGLHLGARARVGVDGRRAEGAARVRLRIHDLGSKKSDEAALESPIEHHDL